MTEIAHVIGADLVLGADGGLGAASGSELTVQRVLRRLMTNPGDYLWQLGYGGGLPRMVGETADALAIAAVIRGQMMQEASVARTPEPTVDVVAVPDGTVTARIQFIEADNGLSRAFVVPIG